MSDAIPSDHPTVDSHRVDCSEVGRTGRPQLLLPTAVSLEEGAYIRLVVDGQQTHARAVSTLGGDHALEGAYSNKRLARTGNGENLLRDWLETTGNGPGSTLVLDVLTEGHAYGLREPGDRVLYEPTDPPNSSLADIAESLGRRDS